ncbi:YpoC family protein [Paenisporosarcina macmurdoensis]|uniref:YpoC family protein n=1 Tax=Paenisporosarcina macmurdoensis TaxID=212659 RepID=A0ABW1L5Z8_9BACL
MIRFDKFSQKDHLNGILQQWFAVKDRIQNAYEQKDQNVHKHMLVAIELYQKLLVEASETVVFDSVELKNYEVLPLNGEERFEFIVTQPSHYAAYRQLNELFEETTKKMARLRIQYK